MRMITEDNWTEKVKMSCMAIEARQMLFTKLESPTSLTTIVMCTSLGGHLFLLALVLAG